MPTSATPQTTTAPPFAYGFHPVGGVAARDARRWTDAEDRETAVQWLIDAVADVVEDELSWIEDRARHDTLSTQWHALIAAIEAAAAAGAGDITLVGPNGWTFYVTSA